MVQYTDLVSDTICAQVTAPGYSGVSVIRVSGDKAGEITAKLCPQLPKENNLESHRVYLSSLCHPDSKERIDQTLVTYFKEGSSFTGDEVIEIACHGSPVLSQKILALYLEQGCRVAERGEFSFRAFYNGKIDLVQAESINQLIHSSSELSSGNALSSLYGGLSDIYLNIETKILHMLAHLEAAIDFVEQDIDPQSYSGLTTDIEALLPEVKKLIESYDIGKNLSADWRVLLVGEANVGKSSLFNCFFNQDKAIVTDTPGTTRDLVQDSHFLGSHAVRFIDSAGLRKNPEEIERLGIEKTMGELSQASLVLWVIDASQEVPWEIFENLDSGKLVVVLNKIDLVGKNKAEELQKQIMEKTKCLKSFLISAKVGTGLDELTEGLKNNIEQKNTGDYKSIVTQSRQYNHLLQLQNGLIRAYELLKSEESPEFISQELQGSLSETQMLLGKKFDDEILDTIFSEFCIGK